MGGEAVGNLASPGEILVPGGVEGTMDDDQGAGQVGEGEEGWEGARGAVGEEVGGDFVFVGEENVVGEEGADGE